MAGCLQWETHRHHSVPRTNTFTNPINVEPSSSGPRLHFRCLMGLLVVALSQLMKTLNHHSWAPVLSPHPILPFSQHICCVSFASGFHPVAGGAGRKFSWSWLCLLGFSVLPEIRLTEKKKKNLTKHPKWVLKESNIHFPVGWTFSAGKGSLTLGAPGNNVNDVFLWVNSRMWLWGTRVWEKWKPWNWEPFSDLAVGKQEDRAASGQEAGCSHL